jgi:hypothetical protein
MSPGNNTSHRKRILEIINAIRAGEFRITDEIREELILLLKDAAWARLVGEPVVRFYSSSFAYEYDRNGDAVNFRFGKPLICEDGGKTASRAPVTPTSMAEYERKKTAGERPVWAQHALRLKELREKGDTK